MSQLKLTLKKQWFDLMITGEKDFEIRRKSDWIISRLFDKKGLLRNYDTVKFTNGYGSDKPFFIVEWKGFHRVREGEEWTFSNGEVLTVGEPSYKILLGEVLEYGFNN